MAADFVEDLLSLCLHVDADGDVVLCEQNDAQIFPEREETTLESMMRGPDATRNGAPELGRGKR